MKYIASCSFGKDSIATIILAHIHNDPLDEIVFAEVMFDETLSGENPLHRDFIYNKAIPIFESWGYKVTVVKSQRMNYIKSYYSVVTKSKVAERNGKLRGWLLPDGCVMNSNCKIQPIRDYFKKEMQKEEITQYIGIAIDEPKRLERLTDNKISLLAKYNYTEQMAYKLCKYYDLLSPIYQHFKRGGCWFCPNCNDKEFMFLIRNYPELWQRLRELKKENLANYKFNRVDTFEELEKRLNNKIQMEEMQLKLFS